MKEQNKLEDKKSEKDMVRDQHKLTNWTNEPTWSDLNNDRQEGSTAQETVRNNLRKWEEYREGGKPVVARPGKSKVRPKLIRKQNEWKYPALEEPFLNTADMFEVKPRTAEDLDAARQNALVLNYQWSTKVNKTKLVNDVVRTIVDEGTVIVKSGWMAEYGFKVVEEEQPVFASPEESLQLMQQAVQAGEMDEAEAMAMMELGQPMQTGTEKVYVERETLIKNHPTYEVIHNSNVIVDPTCEGILENAQFIIHEYPTSLAELKKDAYEKITEEIEVTQDDGTIVRQKQVTESGIYKNLNNITEEEGEYIYDEWDSESANSFKYNDKPRKKLRAFDYWGYWDINGDGTVEPIIATWIGNTMIRMEKNPFPHGELPFSLATYMPVKKETFGEPDAELLIDNQESIGKLTRAMHDITANQAVGQEFIDEQLFPSPVQRDNYSKGNTVFFRHGMNPQQAIYKNTVESIPATVPAFIQSQEADAESLTGTKAFTGGISGNALGDSVGGIRSALDATSKRELSILRRLSDLLFKDLARKTIAMNQAYLDEEEVIRITNDQFVTIRRDDLAGEFDLKVDVSTPEKDNETAEKLNMMLQTNAASMDQEEARIIRGKIARLWKLPDLAEHIENFEPKPDPVAEQIKQIELENAMLKNEQLKKLIEESDSKIHERVSRVIENEKDVENKDSQRRLREAQIRKLESESDTIDQEFVDRQSGNKRARELEDKRIDADLQQENELLMARIRELERRLGDNTGSEQQRGGR